MSYAKSAKYKAARKERRALDRELAKIERARRIKRARMRRIGLRVGAVVGCAALVSGVVLTAQARARAAGVGPENMASDGVVLSGDGTTISAALTDALQPGDDPTATVTDPSGGTLPVVLYVDYRDPLAATWWSMNSSQVTDWVTSGTATLEIHPLALLDGADVLETTIPTPEASEDATDAASAEPTAPTDDPTTVATTGDYSARAAGALACVADAEPDLTLAVHTALESAVATLPAGGLDDDALVDLVVGAGASEDAVSDCIHGHDFADWAADATDRAAESVPFGIGSVASSPVVLVNGTQYTGDLADADAFLSFFVDEFNALTDDGTTTDDSATDDTSVDDSGS